MLVTLLVINAGSLETLPIFMAKVFTDFEAILFSVIGVLICGEIIPMAICTGSSQIKIAERMCPIVLGLMYITSPITWPFGKLLDLWMGEHTAQRFKNQELQELLKLHSEEAIGKINETHLQ